LVPNRCKCTLRTVPSGEWIDRMSAIPALQAPLQPRAATARASTGNGARATASALLVSAPEDGVSGGADVAQVPALKRARSSGDAAASAPESARSQKHRRAQRGTARAAQEAGDCAKPAPPAAQAQAATQVAERAQRASGCSREGEAALRQEMEQQIRDQVEAQLRAEVRRELQAERDAQHEADAAEITELRKVTADLAKRNRALERSGACAVGGGHEGPLRPFELRVGLVPGAAASLQDASQYDTHRRIADKKWSQYTAVVSEPSSSAGGGGGGFASKAAAVHKGLLSVVMLLIACANQDAHSAALANAAARKAQVRDARAGVRTAQKRLAALVATRRGLEADGGGDRGAGAADAARRALVACAADVLIDRLGVIADLAHLALECAASQQSTLLTKFAEPLCAHAYHDARVAALPTARHSVMLCCRKSMFWPGRVDRTDDRARVQEAVARADDAARARQAGRARGRDRGRQAAVARERELVPRGCARAARGGYRGCRWQPCGRASRRGRWLRCAAGRDGARRAHRRHRRHCRGAR
jgi:hypothetical protein